MNTPRRLRDEGLDMGVTVKTVTRWLKGPILLFGIYLVLYGHITPGGGLRWWCGHCQCLHPDYAGIG